MIRSTERNRSDSPQAHLARVSRWTPTLEAASKMPIRSAAQAVTMLELGLRWEEAMDQGAIDEADLVVGELADLVAQVESASP